MIVLGVITGGMPGRLKAQSSAVYRDLPYEQDYSVRYYPGKVGVLHTVLADRNGVVQVLSDSGVLRPQGGRLLYPGSLLKDRVYRPLLDTKISGVCLMDGQMVYLDDKAVFSNAWAGALYVKHGMPGAKIICAGEGGRVESGGAGPAFLVSDGKNIALLGDAVIWQGVSPEEVLAIRWDRGHGLFWLLSGNTLVSFSPATKKRSVVYSGKGLTCFEVLDNKIIAGTHDGYIKIELPAGRLAGGIRRRLPATDITAIRMINGRLWFGSADGVFMAEGDSNWRYFVSERWLPGDKVVDLSEGEGGTVLVLTDKGLGKICFQSMDLEQKAMYYEDIVRKRHIRYGYYSDYSTLVGGDLSTAAMGPHDSDNLWTSMYMAGELFRYLVTHDEEARQNYMESFDAMERLFTLSGVPGLFGRCIERRGIVEFHEEYRKNIESYWYPGYARTPGSWHHSPDSAWDWRGSSSSDQTVGQLFALTMAAQYSDDTVLRQRAIRLIDQLVGYILDNGLKLVDVDGRPTLWGLWGPEYVNRFPNMVGDKKLYASNIIAFLQTAYHFTGKEKYRDKAKELLYKYGYLENLMRPVSQIGPAPASADKWSQELSGGWNNSDDEMYFLAYWGLYPYALDKNLQVDYREAIRDHWNYKRPARDGLWNLCYGMLTGAKEFDLEQTIWELQRMPMDLINWSVHNSHRKDLVYLATNIREQPVRDILPPDERPQNKHNRNLFELDEKGGNGTAELGGGDVYLLPYWMGRYFGSISAPASGMRAGSRCMGVQEIFGTFSFGN